MRSGIFEAADFSGANLRLAKLEGARMAGAVLLGTDMRAIGLKKTDLRGALADRHTKWPDGFDPIAHGVLVGVGTH